MKSIRAFTFSTVVLLTFLSCGGNDTEETRVKIINQQDDVSKMITITKIKKPWYAPKGYVIKKMKKTIPIYRKLQGLQEKNYSFAEGTKYFGGIYHWSSEEEARAWFNDTWFENIKSKYGVAGNVAYFHIVEKMVYVKMTTENQLQWVVLSYNSQQVSKQDDLAQVIRTKNDIGKDVTFSFWTNKSKAKQYLDKQNNAKLMLLPVTIYN